MNPQRLKSIIKLFEACRYRHDLYTLFSDFCEAAAISLSNAVDLRQRDIREARYLEIVGRYERDVIEAFPKILGEITLALDEGMHDVLGTVFHALELHNKHHGQFFTPYDICTLIARMQFGDGQHVRDLIRQKGHISAVEPACGAGAMVIALADTLRAGEINYQHHLHVTAVDIDRRAVHMAYIQFSLLHIPAVVIVGNSLQLTETEYWFTPAHILGGWERRRREASSDQTVATAPIIQSIQPGMADAFQLTLL